MEKENNEDLNDLIAIELETIKRNNETEINKSTERKKKLLYVGIAFVILVLIEYFTRDYSKAFTLKVFCSTDKDRCPYFEYYEFYTFGGRYLLCFLILSYVNIYSALTFMFLDCFIVFLNGVMRFFYLDERPFWKHPELVPCFCATDYGNPSTTGLNTFIMFAVFYKAFTYKSNSKLFNCLIWLVCALNVAYLYVIRMMQNIHYLHQLLYGLAIGYLLYFIIFDIFELDFDDSKQFIEILNSWKATTLAIIGVFTIVTAIHLNLNLASLTNEEKGMIEQNCKLNDLFSLDNESYSKSTRIFEFLGCFLGCWFEYKFIFKLNEEQYTKYNVISNNDMYRHTSLFVSFIRLALLFITQKYALSYLILGKSNFESFPQVSFFYRLLFLQSIPLFIHGVMVFFVIKALMPYLNLTNESIWTIKIRNISHEDLDDPNKRLLQ